MVPPTPALDLGLTQRRTPFHGLERRLPGASCRRTDSTALSHQAGPHPRARDHKARLDLAGTILNRRSHFLMLYPANILKTQRTIFSTNYCHFLTNNKQ